MLTHQFFMRLIFFLVFHFATHLISAQQNELLNRQLNAYEVKFKNLMATRGLSYHEGKVNKNKIANVIREYGEDHTGNPQPVALLFYHFESDTLYHWLFNANGLEVTYHLPITIDSLITLENTLKFSLSIDEKLNQSNRSVIKNQNKKYRLHTIQSTPLISTIFFPLPIAEKLVGKRHLIILPILNVSSFPFALLKPWGDKNGMLIDSLSYSFAHNFTQFFQSVEKNAMGYDLNYTEKKEGYQFRLKDPLIGGNPAFTDSCTNGLPQLPGAESETLKVAELLHTSPLINSAVIKDSVISRMRDSNFIYFATHGWADPESPLDKSFIALNQPDGCGYLTPREIQSMELRQKPIVVLSACQTGLGMIHEAGIVGLARGFLKAGAQSVLMSLWDVNDLETEKLMNLFVQELKQPHPFFPAEHWRQAVLKYKIRKETDPINWSAFQNFGVPYRLLGPVELVPLQKKD